MSSWNKTVLLWIWKILAYYIQSTYFSNRGWTDFPRELPQFTTELRMSNNRISIVRRSTNLNLENLTVLYEFFFFVYNVVRPECE